MGCSIAVGLEKGRVSWQSQVPLFMVAEKQGGGGGSGGEEKSMRQHPKDTPPESYSLQLSSFSNVSGTSPNSVISWELRL